MTDRDLVLKRICFNYAFCGLPISCAAISREAAIPELKHYWNDLDNIEHKVTLYKVKKIVKNLLSENLIEKKYEGGQTEDWKVWCIQGYVLTEKGKQLQLYKDICKQLDDNEFSIVDILPW